MVTFYENSVFACVIFHQTIPCNQVKENHLSSVEFIVGLWVQTKKQQHLIRYSSINDCWMIAIMAYNSSASSPATIISLPFPIPYDHCLCYHISAWQVLVIYLLVGGKTMQRTCESMMQTSSSSFVKFATSWLLGCFDKCGSEIGRPTWRKEHGLGGLVQLEGELMWKLWIQEVSPINKLVIHVLLHCDKAC